MKRDIIRAMVVPFAASSRPAPSSVGRLRIEAIVRVAREQNSQRDAEAIRYAVRESCLRGTMSRIRGWPKRRGDPAHLRANKPSVHATPVSNSTASVMIASMPGAARILLSHFNRQLTTSGTYGCRCRA